MTIAELNDAFRRSFIGGLVLVTRGINSLPSGLSHSMSNTTLQGKCYEAWGTINFSEENTSR